MSADSSPPLDTTLDRSAGVVAIAAEAFSVARRAPALFGLYLIVAAVSLFSELLANLVGPLVAGVAVVIAYGVLGGSADDEPSVGVRLVVVFIAATAAGIAILVGFVFLIVPGVYLLVRLRLVTAAVMLEGCGPIEALSRSFDLTEGHALTVLGVTLLFGGLSLAVSVAIALWTGAFAGGTFDLAAFERSFRIGGAITAILISPVGVAADAVMYGLYEEGDAAR